MAIFYSAPVDTLLVDFLVTPPPPKPRGGPIALAASVTTMHALFTRKVECKMAAAEIVAGDANPYYAAHTRRVSPAALRLPQPKLPGNSNHIARGRIRRFESQFLDCFATRNTQRAARAVIPCPYVTDRPAALIGVPSITVKRMCHDACTGCLMQRALTLTDRRERGR
jgi:hypothetical protein